jgi:hypothetical protein
MDQTRKNIIKKARDKYILTGITTNITEALKIYLAHDASETEQVPLFISAPEINKLKEILKTERPKCDECDADLHMQVGARASNGKEYATAWVCSKCGLIEYSDKTPAEWLKELKSENRG